MISYWSLSIFQLIIISITGLTLLYLGGEFICRGAKNLAFKFNINPLIIGLTIVSIATSLPELTTSLISAHNKLYGISIGNIIGSNIANIGFILGLATIIYPIKINTRIAKIELPFLILISLLFIVFSIKGRINSYEGFFMINIFFIYIYKIYQKYLNEKYKIIISYQSSIYSINKIIFILTLGTIFLWVGGNILINSSIQIAKRLHINESFIGLTIIAIGTSLPELSTSIISALKKENDICVGNIIGSNIFNILFVGGFTSIFYPLIVETKTIIVELPIMIIMTCFLLIFCLKNQEINRKTGFFLLCLYLNSILIIWFSTNLF